MHTNILRNTTAGNVRIPLSRLKGGVPISTLLDKLNSNIAASLHMYSLRLHFTSLLSVTYIVKSKKYRISNVDVTVQSIDCE